MKYYIAWLNGTSVARGTLADVEAKAREIAATPRWRAWHATTTLRITRGARQLLVKSIIIDPSQMENEQCTSPQNGG